MRAMEQQMKEKSETGKNEIKERVNLEAEKVQVDQKLLVTALIGDSQIMKDIGGNGDSNEEQQ